MWIEISQYKDPYELTTIMEFDKGFERYSLSPRVFSVGMYPRHGNSVNKVKADRIPYMKIETLLVLTVTGEHPNLQVVETLSKLAGVFPLFTMNHSGKNSEKRSDTFQVIEK